MLSGLTDAGFEQQEAAAGLTAAPHSSSQLMQLGETEAFCIFDKHLSGVWDIDAYLHHRGRH